MRKISTFNIKNYLSAYFNDMLVDKKNNNEKLLIGELYTINSSDVAINNSIYEMIKIVNKVNGVKINSCVVKRINAKENDCIFSLTKSDCDLIGVDFQEKLELLPLNLDWEIVNNNKFSGFFDENDLSTYPVEFKTKTLKGIIVKIDMGKLLENEAEFSEQYRKYNADLEFKLNDNALYNGQPLSHYFNIKYSVMTNKISLNKSPYDNLIDLDGCIYVEIVFSSKKNDEIGIIPQIIKNKSINDIIISEISLFSDNKSDDEEIKDRIRKRIQTRLNEKYANTTLSNLYRNSNEGALKKQIDYLKQMYFFYDREF